MAEITRDELLFEILKNIQAELGEVKEAQAEHTRQFIRVREDINSLRGDIHGLHADDLQRARMQEKLDVRLERIEKRLGLKDSSH